MRGPRVPKTLAEILGPIFSEFSTYKLHVIVQQSILLLTKKVHEMTSRSSASTRCKEDLEERWIQQLLNLQLSDSI